MDNSFIDEQGVYWESYENYVTIGLCGLCGCGDEGIKEDLVNIIKRTKQIEGGSPMVQFTKEERESPYNELLLHVLDHAKLIEHGTSIYGSWLTEKGKAVKKQLETNPNSLLEKE